MTAIPMESFSCENVHQCEEWYAMFNAFDVDNDGYVPLVDLKTILRSSSYQLGLNAMEMELLLLNIDRNKDQLIDFAEFSSLMLRAKRMHMHRLMLYAARSVLPKSDQTDMARYLLQYSCCPPPLFMFSVSLMQVLAYFYYVVMSQDGVSLIKPEPTESTLILNPYRKLELWRYFTYMFIHVGVKFLNFLKMKVYDHVIRFSWFGSILLAGISAFFSYMHLVSNIVIQILLGLPLELVHKFWRIALIYLLGVMSAALLFFVVNETQHRNIYLAGASGGVYALLSAHIANVIINWNEMEFNWLRAIILTVFVGADISTVAYQKFVEGLQTKVSYISHLGGFFAGLLLGIVILRNLRKLTWEAYAWWTALMLFVFYTLMCFVLILAPPPF